jgi:hypothetical protein
MPRRTKLYAVYGLLLVGAFAVAGWNPLLFQKLNTLRPGGPVPDLDTSRGYVDIEAVLRAVPLGGPEVLSVDPEVRHRRTMVEGGGNCSQMCFGFAYQLARDGFDYQLIHLLTSEGIGIGDGHTLIRIPYRLDGDERVGVVDVSFGSILTGDVGPLDVADLEASPVEGWGYLPLNDAARFPDYYDDFAIDAVVGWVPPSEVREYFAFIDRVYFRLGSERVEKYVFDGLALLFGRLPESFVPRYEQLMASHRGDLVLYRGVLAVMRSAVVIVPLVLGFELLAFVRRRRP